MVFFAVSLIEPFQTGTGKNAAAVAEQGLASGLFFAILYGACRAMIWLLGIIGIAACTGLLLSEVSHANPTVHAAWGYQFWYHARAVTVPD